MDMKRFKNILVVFDSKTDNRSLLDHAIDLVKRNQAALTVVDVIENAPSDLSKAMDQDLVLEEHKSQIPIIEEFPFSDPQLRESKTQEAGSKDGDKVIEIPAIDIQERINQEETRNLQQFLAAFQQAGIQVQSKTIVGVPFIEIIREVLRNQNDLIMITAEGKRSLKETLFGNTTMHLMRKSPCPVWVIKPEQSRKFKRILAAVDLAQGDVERTALATKIMQLSTSSARSGQSELLIFHGWSLYGESVLRGRGGLSSDVMEKLLQETKNVHRQWLIELLQQHPLDDLKSEVYLLKGDAGMMIPELVRSKVIDLVVMGTVSRTGVAGFLIGNTAEKVLHQVDCSILTVKPEGFVTPVRLD